MKNILILYPNFSSKGQPSYERVYAFEEFFINKKYVIYKNKQPKSIFSKYRLLKFILNKNIDNIFISMPQFRNFWLFLIPSINIILDIRDGWSISMKNGYGGSKKKKLRAIIASWVEKFAIRSSSLTITCTNGLKNYLEELSNKSIHVILNGYSFEDVESVKKISLNRSLLTEDANVINAVCVGKFSEYGASKAKNLISKLSKSYFDKKIKIKLIGSDKVKNAWIKDFIMESSIDNVNIEIQNRLSKHEMFKEIIGADLAITLVRDPSYELGTKIYDYILCGIPVFNYFEFENNFTEFFKDYFNDSNNRIKHDSHLFLRSKLIHDKSDLILGSLR